MLETIEKITIPFSIFDVSIQEFINEELKDKIGDNGYKYNLTIHLRSSELTEENISTFESSIKEDNSNSLEKIELVLRMLIRRIIEDVEDHFVSIHQVYVYCNQDLKNEIILEKSDVLWEAKEKEKNKKIHLNVVVGNNERIHKIVDSIAFYEKENFIDERNNDKKLFNSLLLKKEENQPLNYMDLTSEDWKQLVFKEKVTTKELAELYQVKESLITKRRKTFIKSQKEYYDEYVFYEVMFYNMTAFDYFSNFSIPLLEQMKMKNIQVVYEYANTQYHELFHVEEELERQKRLEKDNLEGKDYVVPLSGVLLKKLYSAVKNRQLDRKILKNNYFATYYSSDILSGFVHHIEEVQVLEMYETNVIYKSPYFKTYQELYKMLDLDLNEEEETEKVLTLLPTTESKEHITKKRKRVVVPKDYVKLTKIKNEVGDVGQNLVSTYEWEQLKDYPELQKKIEKTYLIDEGAGYDIKSYDYDGNVIYIEVKTSKTYDASKCLYLLCV